MPVVAYALACAFGHAPVGRLRPRGRLRSWPCAGHRSCLRLWLRAGRRWCLRLWLHAGQRLPPCWRLWPRAAVAYARAGGWDCVPATGSPVGAGGRRFSARPAFCAARRTGLPPPSGGGTAGHADGRRPPNDRPLLGSGDGRRGPPPPRLFTVQGCPGAVLVVGGRPPPGARAAAAGRLLSRRAGSAMPCRAAGARSRVPTREGGQRGADGYRSAVRRPVESFSPSTPPVVGGMPGRRRSWRDDDDRVPAARSRRATSGYAARVHLTDAPGRAGYPRSTPAQGSGYQRPAPLPDRTAAAAEVRRLPDRPASVGSVRAGFCAAAPRYRGESASERRQPVTSSPDRTADEQPVSSPA